MSENDQKTEKKAPQKRKTARKNRVNSTNPNKIDKSRAAVVAICGEYIKDFEQNFNGDKQARHKRRVGRPSKYDKVAHPIALEALMSDGYSFEAACGAMNITKDTGYNWIKKHSEFSDAQKRGAMLSQIWWEQQGKKGMFWGKDFNATIWVFAMKNRFGWKDNRDLNLGGQAGNPINASGPLGAILDEFNDMDDDQLDVEIDKLREKMGS